MRSGVSLTPLWRATVSIVCTMGRNEGGSKDSIMAEKLVLSTGAPSPANSSHSCSSSERCLQTSAPSCMHKFWSCARLSTATISDLFLCRAHSFFQASAAEARFLISIKQRSEIDPYNVCLTAHSHCSYSLNFLFQLPQFLPQSRHLYHPWTQQDSARP